jgi:ElaB/YqjD/DUF883 family membrane-anchored ribosome-binding protein
MSIFSSAVKTELNSTKHDIQDASADISKEFKNFLSDVEDLFKSSTSLTGDDLNKAKEQLNQRIKKARATLDDASSDILQHARRTAALTNEYAHQQPWKVVGAGVAISFLLGYALASRD